MTTTQADYRRQARRIRAATMDAPPGGRLRALRELARRHDAVRVSAPSVEALGHGAAASFAALVAARTDGPVLRYSHRARLLRDAARRGIGRFEANLIIAVVQHRAGESPAAVESRAHTSGIARPWMPVVVGFVATQCAIVTGIWLMMS